MGGGHVPPFSEASKIIWGTRAPGPPRAAYGPDTFEITHVPCTA